MVQCPTCEESFDNAVEVAGHQRDSECEKMMEWQIRLWNYDHGVLDPPSGSEVGGSE